ncbi:hypothetical protein BRD00_09620 [Halobacteriales archaeon QS_8_69_26]|nr:MAG: hypothetical protein BRD00_09620 [Halobacteriales archaeon QS_8_69_26]
MNDDKYPTDTDRRRFTKGVVAGAVLSGVGTTAAAAADPVTTRGGIGGPQPTGVREYTPEGRSRRQVSGSPELGPRSAVRFRYARRE